MHPDQDDIKDILEIKSNLLMSLATNFESLQRYDIMSSYCKIITEMEIDND